MYAIAIITTPDNQVATAFLRDTDWYEHVCEHWDAVVNFMSECIDQNLILNLVTTQQDDVFPDITTYYSVDAASAQQFVDKWMDLDTEFSMRKFWKMIDLSQTSQIEIVDFDNVSTTPLVSTDLLTLWDGYTKSDYDLMR